MQLNYISVMYMHIMFGIKTCGSSSEEENTGKSQEGKINKLIDMSLKSLF